MRPSRRSPRWLPIAFALVFAVGGLSTCAKIEVSAGGDISAADVAAKAEDALAPKVEGDPTITCDEGLSAEAGDRTSCSMTVSGDAAEYAVDATVSRADDAQYSIDFHSDDYHPGAGEGTIFADEIARQAMVTLSGEYGPRADIRCPQDLAGVAGRSVRCVLEADDGDTYRVTATVGRIDGSEYDLDFEVEHKGA
ncbi:MAG: DUF4333 domain-containing protein [Nocardioidaceae bacterium]